MQPPPWRGPKGHRSSLCIGDCPPPAPAGGGVSTGRRAPSRGAEPLWNPQLGRRSLPPGRWKTPGGWPAQRVGRPGRVARPRARAPATQDAPQREGPPGPSRPLSPRGKHRVSVQKGARQDKQKHCCPLSLPGRFSHSAGPPPSGRPEPHPCSPPRVRAAPPPLGQMRVAAPRVTAREAPP